MIVVANSAIFGRNLKCLRELHHLSLAEMAGLLQVTTEKLNSLEQGSDYEIDGTSLRILYKSFDFDQARIFDTVLDP